MLATIGTDFAISYVTGKLAMPRSVIINAIWLSAIVAFVAIPLFGWLSDLHGLDRRADMADFSLSDRAGFNHHRCYDRRARNGRRAAELRDVL
jgi:hypothetical protein